MTDPRKKFRRMVSLKKKRFQDEEFDLDLACNNNILYNKTSNIQKKLIRLLDITDKIIAFGFPSEGTEALFRNPMEDCQRLVFSLLNCLEEV